MPVITIKLERQINPQINCKKKRLIFQINSVKNFARTADLKGLSVIVQTPTPEWEREKNKGCSLREWFNTLSHKSCTQDKEFFTNKENGIYRHILSENAKLIESESNVYLLDTFNIMCGTLVCHFGDEQQDFYSDDDHISGIYASTIVPESLVKIISGINPDFDINVD